MLDIAKVVQRSENKEFDTVVFFDRSDIDVLETQKRIPGARGYPGKFVDIVLLPDPYEGTGIDEMELLSAPSNEPDVASTRERQRQLSLRHRFIQEFPFDVMNLDLEGFFFVPNDPFPGKLISALRKVLGWQKARIDKTNPQSECIDGFSLMFTTQIGPPNLTAEYLDMLRGAVDQNLQREASLQAILAQRTGSPDAMILQAQNFEAFFKIALPKLLSAMLLDEDWYVDPTKGIALYEIERPSSSGPFKMLHSVLDVKRQHPPRDRRSPGSGHVRPAIDAYVLHS